MRNTTILLLVLFCTNVFAQKVIENPIYGFSILPGTITKIEILDTTTVLHFKLKMKSGSRFSIPKKTFIEDLNGDGKLFVTSAEGVKINNKEIMPESGEINYKLFFPKINDSAVKIDFGESNDGGNWFVYDIILNEDELQSKLPKQLIGNWLKTDGSNQWDYGFLYDKAIVDAGIWQYKSVENKKNNYTIILERNGAFKTIYAKIHKNGLVKIGKNKKELKSYSTLFTKNPNYKFKNDVTYTLPIFKNDSTTYSGVVKGYTPRIGKSTGVVYVNNTFTGNQESFLFKIADDGSFAVKFRVAYPQFVLVRGGGINLMVFVEPGKETFHFVNKDENLFMGDSRQINSDLTAMKDINYFDFYEVFKDILTIKPEDFKNRILEIKNREMAEVNDFTKEHFVSQKALQLKKLNIEYSAITNILGYDLRKSSAIRSLEKNKSQKDSIPISDYKLDTAYYDIVTKKILDDKLAVMASEYKYFINRLMYVDIFKNNSRVGINSYTTAQLVELLQKQGVEISPEELKMADASNEIQSEEIKKRQQDFNSKYKEAMPAFIKQYKKEFNEIANDETKSLNFVTNFKEKGVDLSEEDEAMLNALNALNNPKHIEKQKIFNETYGEIQKAFYSKNRTFISDIYNFERHKAQDEKMKEVLGVDDAFVFDVIKTQRSLSSLDRNMVPFTDAQVLTFQEPIKTPFLSDYIIVENERLKDKIDANKIKEGYAVNEVTKTEGDELFDALIKKFRGKVVYVDFWATWCGPCKSGIERIKPLKEEMKDDGVVFLYITNQTSPETTWKNSIPDIKGEHYRVSTDEWNYLTDKFKITGIPHYALVNKKGTVINAKMGHRSNSDLKALFKEEMSK